MNDASPSSAEPGALSRFWRRHGELLVTLLLTSATVLTAWAGYQSAKWSGVQAINFSEAGAARADSNALSSLGGQTATVDVVMFNHWLTAANDLMEKTTFPNGSPEAVNKRIKTRLADPNELPGFLSARFRDEFEVAFKAWMNTNPFTAKNAPKTPFDMDEYTSELLTEAQALREKANASSAEARRNNQQSDNYVALTVLFATVLFLAGLSTKMESQKARMAVFGVGFLILMGALSMLVQQPIEFGEAGIFGLD